LENNLREIVQSFEIEVRLDIDASNEVFDFRIRSLVTALKSEFSSRQWIKAFGF